MKHSPSKKIVIEPEEEILNYVSTLLPLLEKQCINIEVSYFLLRNVKFVSVKFETNNHLGYFLTRFLEGKGYIVNYRYKADVQNVQKLCLNNQGKFISDKYKKGLVSKEELEKEENFVKVNSSVKFNNPRRWNYTFSLPIAQYKFWSEDLLTFLSGDLPELPETERLKIERQVKVINDKLDKSFKNTY